MMNIREFLDQKYNAAANEESSTEGSMVVSSSEGYTYTVTTSSGLYHCSSLIRDLMDLCPDDSSKEPMILKHVTTKSLLFLIEWCDKHRNGPKPSKEEDDEKLTPGEILHGHRFRAYPEADHLDVELFLTLNSLKAVEFYDFIEAANYLMVENFAKSARVWLHYMKPRIEKDFENFMFPEICSPDEPFNVAVLHDERDRLLFLESHYKRKSCEGEGVKKVTTKSGPNEQPSTSREEEPH